MWELVIILIVFASIIIYGWTQGSEEVKNTLKNNEVIEDELNEAKFVTSKRIIPSYILTKYELRIDKENKRIAFCCSFPVAKKIIIKFSDLLECSILEDANTIMSGGVGRALVGGALAGGVGAIVGSTTRSSKNVINSLQLRVVTKDVDYSLILIPLIEHETLKTSQQYLQNLHFANEMYATLTSIINMNNDDNSMNEQVQKKLTSNDLVKQLERLSKLKNDNMITQEEFDELKNKILNEKDEINNTRDNINSNSANDIYKIKDKINYYGRDKLKIIGAIRKEYGLDLKEACKIVDDYFATLF